MKIVRPSKIIRKGVRSYIHTPEELQVAIDENKSGYEKDKVTVIVIARKCSWSIKECLLSIVANTVKNLEIIVVATDYGNTYDDILTIKMQDCRVKIVPVYNQCYEYAALGGLQNATGKYVTFVNGTDYVSPNYVKTLLKDMHRNNDNCVASVILQYYDLNYDGNTKYFQVYDNENFTSLDENEIAGKMFLHDTSEKKIIFSTHITVSTSVHCYKDKCTLEYFTKHLGNK